MAIIVIKSPQWVTGAREVSNDRIDHTSIINSPLLNKVNKGIYAIMTGPHDTYAATGHVSQGSH